jgi:hypothetical protein
MFPSSFNLFLNTHFVPITFLSLGLHTSSHVWFFSIWFNSSSITFTQCWSLLASAKYLGSILDSKERFIYSELLSNFLLVWVWAFLSPRIKFSRWFFCTNLDGVCVSWCSISSSSSSSFSRSSSSYSSSSSLL